MVTSSTTNWWCWCFKRGWTLFGSFSFLSDISALWVVFLFLLEGTRQKLRGKAFSPLFHLSNRLLCLEELRFRNNLEKGSKKAGKMWNVQPGKSLQNIKFIILVFHIKNIWALKHFDDVLQFPVFAIGSCADIWRSWHWGKKCWVAGLSRQ